MRELAKGLGSGKIRLKGVTECLYEPFCKQYQPTKYKVGIMKSFLLMWTLKVRNHLGPHSTSINYMASWYTFPIRHDRNFSFFPHFFKLHRSPYS